MATPSAESEPRNLSADVESAGPGAGRSAHAAAAATQDPPPPGPAEDPRVRISMSPVYGAIAVAITMLSTLTLVTYTLVPLPGQRSLGWWNYVVAGGFLVTAITLGVIFDAREDRIHAERTRSAPRPV